MNVLLTGITGFLGSNLAKGLLGNGHTVVGLKRKASKLSRIDDILKEIILYNVDSIVLDDIFNKNKIDVVIHTATNYGQNSQFTDILLDNELFALKLLTIAIKQDIFFINTHSSLSILTNAYSVSKNNFLNWAKYLANEYINGKIINIVPEHFYGHGDGRFIDYLITSMINKVGYIDLTSGEQERDFIYIKDVVSAYIIILDSLEKLPIKYCDIELGIGSTVTIKKLAFLIKELVANSVTELRFGVIPYRTDELMKSCSNIFLLNSLGWYPHYSLKDGLTDCIGEYLKK